MTVTDQPRKTELVDRLAEEGRNRFPKQAESVERFIREYFKMVSPDDLSADPAVLLGGALSLWELGEVRPRGEAKVRIFNPSAADHGWSLGHTIIEIVNDDMPFLVDSITGELNRAERNIHLVIHPVLHVRRDGSGRRTDVVGRHEGAGDSFAESYMHFEIDQETEEKDLEELRSRIDTILGDVRAAVEDWRLMRVRLTEGLEEIDRGNPPIPADEMAESREFLRWLAEDHFIFLGYRQYRFEREGENEFLKIVPGSGLGILREVRPESQLRGDVPFSPEFSRFARRKELIIVAKANNRSTVHRVAHMDRVGIKLYDDEGNLIGEDRFLGLFTSTAYAQSVRQVPLLRRKVSRIVDRAGLSKTGHSGKELIQILETLPRDEVYQVSEDELFDIAIGILQLQERQRIAVFVRKDVFDRFVSALVYLPRDRYTADVGERIKTILERAFSGTVTAFYQHVSDSPLARGHFIIRTTPGEIPPFDIRQIEEEVARAAMTWSDELRAGLVQRFGEETGLAAHKRFRKVFPAGYREAYTPEQAIDDMGRIEKVVRRGELAIDLYRKEGDASRELHCKLIHTGSAVALSDIVPRLENMGLRVESVVPFEFEFSESGEPVRVLDFELVSSAAQDDVEVLEPKFQEAFRKVWSGETEDDGFNRLVLSAGLEWREIVVLRAYCKYQRQLGTTFSESYMQATLAKNAAVTKLLVQLFEIQFDPSLDVKHRAKAPSIRAKIEELLEGVTNLDEDRILRQYLNLIESTLRTNFHQSGEAGKPRSYLSFKFDSRAVAEMPQPRPMFEIFVYSPRFEAIHLRGGKVARGGVRWSDRREDFRTEVLGLMKAQMVKNTVIVPVGSKGGFVLKQPPAAREELLREGVACYKDFIRGMLDLTDNIVDKDLVPPPRVVRRDDDDPYLVVAADKGTATFSDIANSVSAEYGFWLGDAFASGGSAGYDHKAIGITARGAWEAVKRHFRELGRNIQEEDFTCVGVGDMSGDVFGNGMLLSRHTKLIGAFNHLHVFVDPDPDPEASFAERKRLFEMPRSSWTDYDAKVLSKGGAVYDRKAKSIRVSDEVRRALDLPKSTLTPNSLIQGLLRAPADLLWLGGIGTYVKSAEETHAAVGDRSNDAVRIDGWELRTRVVGEGANLGLTQRGRIEFALRGGKINTDAIDNSAGVDTSDHEVNLKILLDAAMRKGQITPEQRLPLLVEMTEDVASLVLRDNYQQTQAISIAETQAVSLLDQQARTMKALEKAGKLDRVIEALPDDETLADRGAAKLGLTRPEIAVLLAYGKIALYDDLLGSDLPDDPLLIDELIAYFPPQVRHSLRDSIEQHRLRREIIATFVTNNMVNRVGPTFVHQMMEETGRSASDVARAYAIARNSFDTRSMFGEIELLDNKVPAALQLRLMIEVGHLVERSTRWFLKGRIHGLDIMEHEAEFRPRIAALEKALESILPDAEREQWMLRIAELERLGIPPPLARRLAALDLLSSFNDIVRIQRDTRRPIEEVGRIYFAIGSRFDFDRLRAVAGNVSAENPWQKAAIGGVIDDLFLYQSIMTAKALAATPPGEPGVSPIERWLGERADLVRRVEQVLAEIRSAPAIDMPMIAVATRQLRALVET
ncbi:MAG TPA: NAD-glutamate dehydrogenase [Thermoanaerobaculia bacterium]|nr:NAD-glutamate dehydrogenase [Thermoanaerobaculia bacterium]